MHHLQDSKFIQTSKNPLNLILSIWLQTESIKASHLKKEGIYFDHYDDSYLGFIFVLYITALT